MGIREFIQIFKTNNRLTVSLGNFIFSLLEMRIIYLLLIILIVQSCTFIHYINTKEITPKNEQEISKYLKSNNIDFYDYSFILSEINIDSLSNKIHALDLWKYKNHYEQSTIQIRVYNSSGNLVNGYTQCYGNINKINILSQKETKKFKQFPNNYSLLFENELSLLNISEEIKNEIKLKSNQKTYTIVVYWNIWSNYFSKITLQKVKQYLKEFKLKDEVLTILINTDNIKNTLVN